MNLRKPFLLLAAWTVCAANPAWAQVDKVAMRTTGISCGVCAGLSEIYFKRMAGVDKVTISLSKEAVMLTYKPGAPFDPPGIRKLLKSWEVGVVQFQINAHGRVQESAGKRLFLAGKDRFLVTSAAPGVDVPLGTSISIEAILDDHPSPMEIRILNFKPSQQP